MSEIPLGLYIFKRLYSLGLRSVYGVPGDYNLALLDYIYEVKGLEWVGNCNELNAAYAADGHARVKGISAIITTFGVGELSALNGIAGAYSEHVPVIHIVGCPSTSLQRAEALLHHTLGNGDFHVFRDMSRPISVAQAYLDNPLSAPAEFDRVIREAYIQARPAYVLIPTDVVPKNVSSELLSKSIDFSLPENDPETEDDVLKTVLDMLYKAKSPVLVADACCIRHHVVDETLELLHRLQIPGFVTPMGKGAIDESNPHYGGVYLGKISVPEVKEAVESSDCVLSVGALLSDFNTGSFSYHIAKDKVIEFHSTWIKVRYASYPGIGMKNLFKKLLAHVDPSKVKVSVKAKDVVPSNKDLLEDTGGNEITHTWLWPTVGNFLRPKDIVVTETGTSSFGITDARFPKGVIGITQVLWGSIGYATPSSLGAALALREIPDGNERRVILFTGEGSLQLTVQEISSMVRHGLTPILFIINNNGYTVEKLIHGRDKKYNNLQQWRYTRLLDAFGAENPKSYSVRTKAELSKLFNDEAFASAKEIQLVELIMGEFDAPRGLKIQGELIAKRNAA